MITRYPRKGSFINKSIYGYSDGDTLYLNGFKQKTGFSYAKLIDGGKYLIFKAGISTDSKMRKNTAAAGAMFGPMGGALAGAAAAKVRLVYALDTATGELLLIDPNQMRMLLRSKPDLLESFKAEFDQNDQNIQIRYLQQLNESFR